AAAGAEILDLAFLPRAAVIVVAAHRDAAGPGVALDHELHHRRGLTELGPVRVVREELLGAEDPARSDDERVLTGIEDLFTEAVRDIGRLEIAAFHEVLDDRVAADTGGDAVELVAAQAVDRLEHRGR